jgi:anti-anti-sigma factor
MDQQSGPALAGGQPSTAPPQATPASDGEITEAERKDGDELARRLAAIVESSSDAIVGKTLGGVITSWNAGAEALYGYTRSEAIGWPVAMLIPPDRPGEEQAMVARLLAGERIRDYETERQRKDGSLVPVSLTASLITGATGEARGVASIARDITERRQAAALQERLAAIVEASVDAIVGFDLDGVITSWNPAAWRLLGYLPADAVGRHFSMLAPPEGQDDQERAFARVLREGVVRDWKTEVVRHDGTVVPVSLALSLLLDSAGAPSGVAGVLRDLSESERYEREHHIAETLQRILMPEEPPELPGLSVATRYFPGSAGLHVGGDWYDVFTLPGGRVGVVVGDVVGRGIGAAAVMGQLRVALRAYALEFNSPARVLACLGRLARSLDESQMATVLYGVVDPEQARIELASAGHPPPLMVRVDGEVSFLDVDSGPPLGVLFEPPPIQVVERLEPGCLLLFYTDGLIERRGASIEDGMATVARASTGTTDVETLCERVSQAMNAEDAPDDVALLALSLNPTPATGDRRQVADSPTAAQALRAADDVVVVALRGDIDLMSVGDAKQTLVEAATSSVTGMVIDLSEVTFLDSSGVNLLFLTAIRLEQRKQRAAVVVRPGSFLRKVLSVTALDRLVPLFSDVSDAVAALRGMG